MKILPEPLYIRHVMLSYPFPALLILLTKCDLIRSYRKFEAKTHGISRGRLPDDTGYALTGGFVDKVSF